jgi:hypothetical protein
VPRRSLNRKPAVVPLNAPPAHRLTTAGVARVMRAEWVDPDDVKPTAARTARHISGWRSFCPLRRMNAVRGAQVTERHILAADLLRSQVDLAVIGRGALEMIALMRGFGPVAGPSVNAVEQVWASVQARRALARLSPAARVMLTEVVLFNRSIQAWCALNAEAGRPANRDVEMGKLIGILDTLADHYAAEVDEALARGAMIA